MQSCKGWRPPVVRSRYQKQLERDEMEFQQQKRKLTAEFEEIKHNLTESMKLERKQAEVGTQRGLLQQTCYHVVCPFFTLQYLFHMFVILP
jgi:hypothetical protein